MGCGCSAAVTGVDVHPMGDVYAACGDNGRWMMFNSSGDCLCEFLCTAVLPHPVLLCSHCTEQLPVVGILRAFRPLHGTRMVSSSVLVAPMGMLGDRLCLQ